MPFEFRLPDVGEGIDAAEIVEWKVSVGDEVAEDTPLVDVESDKAIVTIPSPTGGVVLRLGAEVGASLQVGEVLAVLGEAGELEAAAAAGERDEPADADAVPGRPVTKPSGAADLVGLAAAAARAAARPLASPAVRRLAREQGIDLTRVDGGGRHGRIRREDVEAARVSAAPAQRSDVVEPLRGIRRTIARTLTHSWQTIPHVIDYREADAGALVELRSKLRARAERGGDAELSAALTLTPLLVKIAATLLARHPRLNAAVDMERDEITLHGSIDVGVAAATPQGLLVPVVRAADTRSLREIALEVASLAVAARTGELTAGQLTGATFTVNNYGALGVWLGTPIIGPGQTANLGVGRLERQPVVRGDELVIRPLLTLACAADHRLIDGDTLAHFVSDFVDLVEEPSLLLQDLR